MENALQLKQKSDSLLMNHLKILVAKEREILSEVLNYLREVQTRKLYLARGYASIFAFMTVEFFLDNFVRLASDYRTILPMIGASVVGQAFGTAILACRRPIRETNQFPSSHSYRSCPTIVGKMPPIISCNGRMLTSLSFK